MRQRRRQTPEIPAQRTQPELVPAWVSGIAVPLAEAIEAAIAQHPNNAVIVLRARALPLARRLRALATAGDAAGGAEEGRADSHRTVDRVAGPSEGAST